MHSQAEPGNEKKNFEQIEGGFTSLKQLPWRVVIVFLGGAVFFYDVNPFLPFLDMDWILL